MQPTRRSPFSGNATNVSHPLIGRRSTRQASTARPRTARSTLGAEEQEIICAVSESRGFSPVVGIALVNLETGEVVLSQVNDSQTYVRTVHKLAVFNPSVILIVSTAADPKSKLFSVLEDSLDVIQAEVLLLDRRYWAETTGLEYIQQLALPEEIEALRTAVSGHYYAVCCFAAALKYVDLGMSKTFSPHSLRIRYEPAEGSMMIDIPTIRSLELMQNLTDPKSKESLFGHLNHTFTPMGRRLLRGNILQPLIDLDTLTARYDALEELSTKEQMFFAVRQAIRSFTDVDRILTQLIIVPTQESLQNTEQTINNIIFLKRYVSLVPGVFHSLSGAQSSLLREIRGLSAPQHVESVRTLIDAVINEDTTHASQPLDLRNQRTYAVKSGVNGLLDVARQTYEESMEDAMNYLSKLVEDHGLQLQTKFDNSRQFYLRLRVEELERRNLPTIFINVVRKRDWVECQTLDLLKFNQRMSDSTSEAMSMSDKAVRELVCNVREHIGPLFKTCEAVAMLDMLAAFAHLVSTQDYVRPQLTDTLAIKAARHPIRERGKNVKFIPNDMYATQQTRFQIVTGCNMSGKSTYIRSVALMTVMIQIGCFVPAQYASFPLRHQLLARVSSDDSIEANVSTFAAEMREAAFILSHVDGRSLAIVDELGRGTSTRDGLAIAIAIAEALIESRALVWFATHFQALANVLSERSGVRNLHLAVDNTRADRIEMQYRISPGAMRERHYGIKLAKILPLPSNVIELAELVSSRLTQMTQRQQAMSLTIIRARKRKLMLNLREHLVQASSGCMSDEILSQWLVDLQHEFVVQMSVLDEQERNIIEGPRCSSRDAVPPIEEAADCMSHHSDLDDNDRSSSIVRSNSLLDAVKSIEMDLHEPYMMPVDHELHEPGHLDRTKDVDTSSLMLLDETASVSDRPAFHFR